MSDLRQALDRAAGRPALPLDVSAVRARTEQRRRHRRALTAAAVLVPAVALGAGLWLRADSGPPADVLAPSEVRPSGTPRELPTPAPSDAASPTASTAPPATGTPAPSSDLTPPVESTPPAPSSVAPEPSDPAEGTRLTLQSGDVVWFRTPSDNIGCEITPSGATCDVRDRTWDIPAKPADCDGDFGQGVYLDVATTGLRCATDTPYSASSPVLPYGQGWVLGDVQCTSSRDGVTCRNSVSGAGFAVSRNEYRFF